MDFLTTFSDYNEFPHDGFSTIDAVVRLCLAMILGIAVGIERSKQEQSAGMRTYSVVSVASALIMIVSIYGLPAVEGQPQDPGRIAAQVVSGIGFLGAGLIFMRKSVVHGLTTAASLWAVSGVGLAVGGGLLVTGSIATLLILLISGGLRPVKKRFFHHEADNHRVQLHLSESTNVIRDIREMASNEPRFTIASLDMESKPGRKTRILDLRISVQDPDDAIEIVHKLEQLPSVEALDWHAGSLD